MDTQKMFRNFILSIFQHVDIAINTCYLSLSCVASIARVSSNLELFFGKIMYVVDFSLTCSP